MPPTGYDQGGFTPSVWRETSVPHKPVRGIYFATHFYNFYHATPTAEIERYVEDLGLWGYNSLAVWYDMHPPQVRKAWRWRQLYLRALLDAELKANKGSPNARCNEAFAELIEIYHAQNADPCARPPFRGGSQ